MLPKKNIFCSLHTVDFVITNSPNAMDELLMQIFTRSTAIRSFRKHHHKKKSHKTLITLLNNRREYHLPYETKSTTLIATKHKLLHPNPQPNTFKHIRLQSPTRIKVKTFFFFFFTSSNQTCIARMLQSRRSRFDPPIRSKKLEETL